MKLAICLEASGFRRRGAADLTLLSLPAAFAICRQRKRQHGYTPGRVGADCNSMLTEGEEIEEVLNE